MVIGIAGVIMASICGVAGLLISLLVVHMHQPSGPPRYDKTMVVVVSTLVAAIIGGIGGVVAVAHLFMSGAH